jgi:peptide/nickel transport system ATP-binding protein
MTEVVAVKALHVSGRDDAGREAEIVSDVSLAIASGEVLALIGESGSGKSTIALALMGYARPGCRITGGSVSINGDEVLTLSAHERARLRGRRVAYVAQSAAAAFNPAKRIITQIIEGARIHGTMAPAEARQRAVELFAALTLPDPERFGERFPHQVSGGQLQRAMLAMALFNEPEVIILDEPTTALDVTTQIEVLLAFRQVVRDRRTTALYVSHDLAVVAQVADRIIVLQKGRMQESGPTERLLEAPGHEYTRSLLDAADPAARIAAGRRAGDDRAGEPLLVVSSVTAGYGTIDRAGRPAATVLHGVDLEIRRGSAVGVIGESGSGKSTLARVIAGLIPAASGSVGLAGRRLAPSALARTLADLRDIQIVFQMADTALNPVHTIGRILGRPASLFDRLSGAALERRVSELLDMVQLPAAFAKRRPAELSGGQKQRVNLARALAASPKLILCDEVTSSLDTVVGAAILRLLGDLRARLGLSYLFISHDLSTVRAVCDEVVVLYAGRRVESTRADAISRPPVHPYVDLLVSSIPELRTGWLDGIGERGLRDAPGVARARPDYAACAFSTRCNLARPGLCDTHVPPVQRLSSGALIACHISEADLAAHQSATSMAIASQRRPA